MDVGTVHTIRVNVGDRRRRLDRAAVKRLADSLAEVGLLNPITVCEAGDEYALVAGRHRLEAARLLGWREVPAVVVDLAEADRHLAEIDENLVRNDLTDLERAEHLAARKRWYEAKHPEAVSVTKRGGPGRGKKTVAETAAVSFAADAADKTGQSARTIREDVQIAESIPDDVREAIRDTPLADSKADLLALARLPADDQRAVVSGADLSDKRAVRAAMSERQGFACKACGQEQTMRVWHCDGCGEHWLPGEACGECRPPLPPTSSEPADVDTGPETVTVEVSVEAFARAIASLFGHDDRSRLIDLIREETAPARR